MTTDLLARVNAGDVYCRNLARQICAADGMGDLPPDDQLLYAALVFLRALATNEDGIMTADAFDEVSSDIGNALAGYVD